MKTVLIVLSLTLMLLVSCAPKPTVEPLVPVRDVVPPVGPVAADRTVSEIESSMAEVDELEKELDMSLLDELDADLAELDALDLG